MLLISNRKSIIKYSHILARRIALNKAFERFDLYLRVCHMFIRDDVNVEMLLCFVVGYNDVSNVNGLEVMCLRREKHHVKNILERKGESM